MTIGVTGATGFVGREVVRRLLARGDAVVALTRDVERARASRAALMWRDVGRLEWRRFDPLGGHAQPLAFEGLDAVMNLAGEPVSGRWTERKKAAIRASRVDGTRCLVASLAALSRRPRALINASAVGYYGARGDEPLSESASPGRDFLAQTCVAWEAAADEARALGMRVTTLRQGIVLGDGGALAAMIPLFQCLIGGPMGSGRQWWPWIHIDDDARLALFALDDDRVFGPINAVAPDYATNARFAQALGNALRRPSLAFAPAIALRVVLGEFATSLLTGQLVLPSRALDLGFAFDHESLERALVETLGDGPRATGTHRFHAAQQIGRPLDAVFAFFADAGNLQRITPPAMRFRIVNPAPIEMRRGTLIDYELRVRGLPARWRTMITEWRPTRGFVDVQLRGPYALWRHHHRFTARAGGTLVEDDVEYALPFAPLGELAGPLVRGDIEAIFRYRKDRIETLLGAL